MTPQKNWKLTSGAVPANLESQDSAFVDLFKSPQYATDGDMVPISPSMPLSPTTRPPVILGPRHHHDAPPFHEPWIFHNSASSTGHNCHNTTQGHPTEYSNEHAPQSPQFSSQHFRTNQTMDLTFGPKISTSGFPQASNDSPNQWQNPQPGLPTPYFRRTYTALRIQPRSYPISILHIT
ncbi:hypothetical protein AZE42_09295 [Rhizopogon vesiculosus]|uniref:Uncharacterized protein n=1 Tax=Rhizopogon vesiculosus TaxID=180088 RepID=A0A1J8QTZ6_9AGAM|nr:hypothetical protein AZE42_09295 [Rhizopogon vesiculosus]